MEQPAQQAAGTPARRISGRLGPMSVVKAAGAVIGVVGALIGVVFALWPSLQPDPPAQVKGATLQELSADEIITRRQYFQRAELPADGLTKRELAERGVLVTFDITIEGFKDQKLPLRWELIDAVTGDQLEESASTIFRPGASKDAASWQEWIPLPTTGRKYVVVVRLYNPTGLVPLAARRSAPITLPPKVKAKPAGR